MSQICTVPWTLCVSKMQNIWAGSLRMISPKYKGLKWPCPNFLCISGMSSSQTPPKCPFWNFKAWCMVLKIAYVMSTKLFYEVQYKLRNAYGDSIMKITLIGLSSKLTQKSTFSIQKLKSRGWIFQLPEITQKIVHM